MESGGVVCSVPADPTSSNSESPVKVQTVAEEEESSSSSQPLGEDSEKEAADKTSEQTRRESENEEVVVLDHPNDDDDSDNKADNEEAVEEESKENGIASKDGEDEVVLELDPIALVAVEVEDDEEDVDKEANPISSPPPTQPSKTVEGRAKTPEEEMQQSSTCSSPSSTLHIHLDEEDKDESVNDKDKDIKETTDPSLPLISNVVSLSTVGQSGAEDTKPVTTPSSSPTPSGGEGNNSNSSATPRRTTLRLKRGIEISFDVDQNGQPVTVNNNHSSGSSALPSGSSGEPRQKRGRLDDEDEEDLSELDVEGTNGILASVQKDIRTLRFMAKQKEKEWNYILKLMKVKEELQAKLMRRREVLKITTSSLSAALSSNSMLLGGGRNKHLPSSSQPQVAAQQILHGHQTSQASIQSFINQSLHAIKSSGKNSGLGSSASSFSGSHGQQQQHHQSSSNKMLQQNRQRPILPKPSMQVHQSEVQQMWGHHHSSNHHASHHQNLLDATLNLDDHHHRQQQAQQNQGTINVQSLIADYRAKHPEEIPTRGRRIRQPSRICNDPNSSSSPPPSQNSNADAAGVSFKDVLLQFAKMSSRQGLTNAVDMSQLGKEAIGNSVSGMSGGSGNSSAAALQNLAAARNARGTSSPGQHHTPGSILQSALSGGSRTNPTFAPTLAQLLTNPAGDSQQLSSNHSVASLPASAAAVNSASSSSVAAAAAAASAAEVLTLSNLLATAKGHVTITSDRDHNNDDITVVGGTTSVRSGGPSNNTNNGNYLRTSGGSEVPKCQGCSERVAQFVCAGCSSQWYCSRECQVAAWEEHSEHCVG